MSLSADVSHLHRGIEMEEVQDMTEAAVMTGATITTEVRIRAEVEVMTRMEDGNSKQSAHHIKAEPMMLNQCDMKETVKCTN